MPVSGGVYTLPWTFIARFAAGDIIPRSDFDTIFADVETGLNSALSAQSLMAWSPAGGTFPSGASTGASYYATTAGTIDSTVFGVGDVIYALTDSPSTSTYANNWRRIPREALSQTRAQLKAWIGAGNTPADNVIYPAGGLFYIGSTGATSIPDMAGLLPFGDLYVEHMGAVGDGVTDDTNPFQYAINYLSASGGVVNLKPLNYIVTLGSLSVGAKQVLWKHEGANINGVTTPDIPGTFHGFDPDFGRWLTRVDRANLATGQPVHWVRDHNPSGAAIGPIYRLIQFLDNGSLVNGIAPNAVMIDQEVATESADMGSSTPTGFYVRTQGKAGIDGVGLLAVDIAVNNCEQPDDPATEPADNIATRAGSMRAVSLNAYRASAWNDAADATADQADVFLVDARGGGEVHSVLGIRSHSAHIHPWSGIAVGGTGASGNKLVLPNETTFSQTDNTWFTAETHWVYFDKEVGYDDPVTLYRITAFAAATREITLDTALPVDAAGKRISIVGVYQNGVVRNLLEVGQFSMNALAGVTIRNTSGKQASEVVSTSNYQGAVFDYSGATFTGLNLFTLPAAADIKHNVNAALTMGFGSLKTSGTVATLEFFGNNDAAERTAYGQVRGVVTDDTDGAEIGQVDLYAMNSGTMQLQVSVTPSAFVPRAATVVDVGSAALPFRNVHGMPVTASYTAANIASSAHAVNTSDKFVGKIVFDTTNNRLMVAAGTAPTSNWHVADGSVAVTPS